MVTAEERTFGLLTSAFELNMDVTRASVAPIKNRQDEVRDNGLKDIIICNGCHMT